MGAFPNAQQRWGELTRLLERVDRRGFESLTVEDVKRLGQLYRHVTIDLSRARTEGGDLELVQFLNLLAARAHGCVYRSRQLDIRPLVTFIATGFPRLVRHHALPILASTAVFLLTALASFLAVARQPDLAYSL